MSTTPPGGKAIMGKLCWQENNKDHKYKKPSIDQRMLKSYNVLKANDAKQFVLAMKLFADESGSLI